MKEIELKEKLEDLISAVLPKGSTINAKRVNTCSLDDFLSITPSTMMVKSGNRVVIEDYERYYLVRNNNIITKFQEKIVCYHCKGDLDGTTEVVQTALSIGKQIRSISPQEILFIIHDSYRDAPLDDADYPAARIIYLYQIK